MSLEIVRKKRGFLISKPEIPNKMCRLIFKSRRAKSAFLLDLLVNTIFEALLGVLFVSQNSKALECKIPARC